MAPHARLLFCVALFCVSLPLGLVHAGQKPASLASESLIVLASGPPPKAAEADKDDDKEELTPEQKMQKRFPQPVRVGDLIGLPVLDEGDSTIGYVREVARTEEGKVVLIVPYSAWFGWARTERGKRPVAVPIETVAILAKQINALDFARSDFDEADDWDASEGKLIPAEEKTLIALGRR